MAVNPVAHEVTGHFSWEVGGPPPGWVVERVAARDLDGLTERLRASGVETVTLSRRGDGSEWVDLGGTPPRRLDGSEHALAYALALGLGELKSSRLSSPDDATVRSRKADDSLGSRLLFQRRR